MINLMKGDCLEKMKLIPDGSVDAVICDPPYGTTACKWDTVINFELMWEQLNRIIKKNGAIVLFGSEPFSSALRMSNIKNYKYDWVWIKNRPVGFVNAKLKPMNKHEVINVFSTGKTSNCNKNNMPYFPQGLKSCNKLNHNGNKKEKDGTYWRPSQKKYTQTRTNYPTSDIYFKKDEGKNRFHPTQKPVALLEYLIRTYTNENQTVLDFTMGSGSTGVACINTNRYFIGIEKDETYFNTAKERIEKTMMDKTA